MNDGAALNLLCFRPPCEVAGIPCNPGLCWLGCCDESESNDPIHRKAPNGPDDSLGVASIRVGVHEVVEHKREDE